MAYLTPLIRGGALPLAIAIAACGGGGGGGGGGNGEGTLDRLACNDSLRTRFKPDADTTVLFVRQFRQGDALLLSGTPTPATPTAAADVCVVKLLVGPGNPGPADAASTSPGIGIEIWLPAPAQWNKRVHALGGGGWAGGAEVTSTTSLAGANSSGPGPSAATVAGVEGAVSAVTDTGHAIGNGSFAMKPDGAINTALWTDFARRSIHEEIVKAKALAAGFYGEAPKTTYWDGFSTGGRQGHAVAQAYPTDVDGILAGAPALSWSRLTTSALYPQIVHQRDLGGIPLSPGQLALLGNAAIDACDMVGGVHLGYIPDPSTCRYDPALDPSVVCSANGGTNSTTSCVTPVQAAAQNKFWYGQTADGSVPAPAIDNGFGIVPNAVTSQRWYGLARGASSVLAGAEPLSIATDQVALQLQDPAYATPAFRNATGNGSDQWKTLSYARLSNAFDQGIALQPSFGNVDTDNPDLSRFRDSGAKMLMYHGLADILVPPQGSINYYHRVASQMGGIPAIQSFYRFYLVPGMAHGLGNGTTNPDANPPLPTHAQLYAALTDWVERGIAPSRIDIASAVTATFPTAKSRPICVYPQKATHSGGDVNLAASYTCS